eukprot:scaffold3195_cov162-Amphora_coffeaeformis.AAC.17
MPSSSASSSEDEDKRSAVEEEPPTKRAKTNEDVPLPMPVADGTTVGPTPSPQQKPVIILLDQATLETVKNKRGVYELLNCDDHRELCKRKLKKDPNAFRPDILHQELLALMDSPLNKAGMLKIYIQTQKKVLIDIHPSVRIPRTYKRFSGLMVQLLHKMKIKAGTESTVLLKVIKNPFSQYLPAGTRCYGMEPEGQLYSPLCLARAKLPPTSPDHGSNSKGSSSPPTCFVVGAMSTGNVTLEDHPYMEEMISVSQYPLSGAAALSRIVCGIEEHWGIV